MSKPAKLKIDCVLKDNCSQCRTHFFAKHNDILKYAITVERPLLLPIDKIFGCVGRTTIITYIKEIELMVTKLEKKKRWLLLSASYKKQYLIGLFNNIDKPLEKVQKGKFCSHSCWKVFQEDLWKIRGQQFEIIECSQFEYTAKEFLENSLAFVKLLKCNQQESIVNCTNYRQFSKSYEQYCEQLKFNSQRQSGKSDFISPSRYYNRQVNCKGVIKGYLLFSEIEVILQVISNKSYHWNDLSLEQKARTIQQIFDYCHVLIFKWQVSSNCVTCQQWCQKTYFAYVTRLEEEFENLVEKGEGGFQNFLIAVKKTESQFYSSVVARRDCQAYKQYYE